MNIVAVTIKQIADICGVSRGTVDRVINERGKVKPETEKLVRETAARLGYQPNLAGRALAARKRAFTIGVVLTSEGNAFFDDVLKGIARAEKEIADYGARVILKTMRGYSSARQIELISELAEEADAVILNPVNDQHIKKRIDDLTEKGKYVITVNTDIQNSKRLCYIGSHYQKGGETACGMLGLITGGRAEIGIVAGSEKVLGHVQRVQGFLKTAQTRYPGFRVADTVQTDDDEIQAFEVTRGLLECYPRINALFIAAGGVYGTCRAVQSMGKKLNIVCFDSVPNTTEMLKNGVIQAVICQQPFTQGYRCVRIAFDTLLTGQKPEKEYFYCKNEIKIAENIN